MTHACISRTNHLRANICKTHMCCMFINCTNQCHWCRDTCMCLAYEPMYVDGTHAYVACVAVCCMHVLHVLHVLHVCVACICCMHVLHVLQVLHVSHLCITINRWYTCMCCMCCTYVSMYVDASRFMNQCH